MDALCAFFSSHMTEIYFVYGLGFFVTGIVVWMESQRSAMLMERSALLFFALFGVIHGVHEWVEMFQLLQERTTPLLPGGVRILVLIVSFVLLLEFGLRLVAQSERGRWTIRLSVLTVFAIGLLIVCTTWSATAAERIAAADAWCRYSLAVPSALLSAVGLLRLSRSLSPRQEKLSQSLLIVGIALLLYGFPGQVFVSPSPLPPSNVVNSAFFMDRFHFPIQLWRTVMACTMAIFTARAQRLGTLEQQRQVQELYRSRVEAQQQLHEELVKREVMRRQFVHQTVQAQEEERRSIARELHDEVGQSLTALSWGLADLERRLRAVSDDACHEARNLQQLAQHMIVDLRRLMARLRPAMLDELGLVAALITHADNCSDRFPFSVDVKVEGQRRRLPSEIETTLYRVVQEALTNVAKHAQAAAVQIQLRFEREKVTLVVQDDGVGIPSEVISDAFDHRAGWGLNGIRERVEFVDGRLELTSTPETGTTLNVWIPLVANVAEERAVE